MVNELHKLGYQNLAVYTGMSSSGMHWRCYLTPFADFYINPVSYGVELVEYDVNVHYSSGEDGYDYFGWDDAKNDTARELAVKFIARFPRLVEQCQGNNFAYAGWFTYMLGVSETGALPVMYRDYYQNRSGKIETTDGDVLIQTPPFPHPKQFYELKYTIIKAPHLKAGDDWHDAYIPIIEKLMSDQVLKIPEYPIYTESTFELGAYWEGALYFIQEVLGFTTIVDFLSCEEANSPTSKAWQIFQLCWNSHGQLQFLKALLIRYLLLGFKQEPLSDELKAKYVKWLKAFEATHNPNNPHDAPDGYISAPKHITNPYNFENPYFSGLKPLHLGLVLPERRDGKKLI